MASIIRMISKELIECHDIRKLYLSGAFGNVYQIKNNMRGN